MVSGEFTIENDQNDVRITGLLVAPFDPAPGEDYVVTASYECYGSNIHVNMSIIGTDHYIGHSICTSGPSCTLYVPGAEALVQDLVTVTAQDEATTAVRRVTIIF